MFLRDESTDAPSDHHRRHISVDGGHARHHRGIRHIKPLHALQPQMTVEGPLSAPSQRCQPDDRRWPRPWATQGHLFAQTDSEQARPPNGHLAQGDVIARRGMIMQVRDNTRDIALHVDAVFAQMERGAKARTERSPGYPHRSALPPARKCSL